MRFKIQTLNNIASRASSACRATASKSPPRSTIPTPSWCARPTCTSSRLPRHAARRGPRRRGHQQHPGRGAVEEGHPGVQRARRQCQRREGAGARRHVPRGAQHLPRPGRSRSRSSGDDHAIDVAVEKGKKNFVGFELPGRTLGVVGLGAIGVEVANSALALGMKVLGYDPQITVQRAWQLSSSVEQALSLDDLFVRADVDHGARAAQRPRPADWSTRRASSS